MHAISAFLKKNDLSQKDFGELVGVAQSMVNMWLSGAKRVGAERAVIIEKKTRGRIKRHELRPDIFEKRAA